jgi:hypothetical protein
MGGVLMKELADLCRSLLQNMLRIKLSAEARSMLEQSLANLNAHFAGQAPNSRIETKGMSWPKG